MKALVLNSKGFQELRSVTGTTKFFSGAFTVIWDERLDGPMPAVPSQGMKKQTVDGVQTLVVDQSDLATQQEAKDAFEASEALVELAQIMQKRIEGGAKVVAFVAAKNILKNLNETERLAFGQTFSSIKGLLDQGLLSEAKTAIQALTLPEGWTNEDRNQVIAKLDEQIAITAID